MKKSRFSEEQIIAILRAQEAGAKTADVCRRLQFGLERMRLGIGRANVSKHVTAARGDLAGHGLRLSLPLGSPILVCPAPYLIQAARGHSSALGAALAGGMR